MYAAFSTSVPAHKAAAHWDARWSYGSGSPLCHVDLGMEAHLALDVDGMKLLLDVLERALEQELGHSRRAPDPAE